MNVYQKLTEYITEANLEIPVNEAFIEEEAIHCLVFTDEDKDQEKRQFLNLDGESIVLRLLAYTDVDQCQNFIPWIGMMCFNWNKMTASNIENLRMLETIGQTLPPIFVYGNQIDSEEYFDWKNLEAKALNLQWMEREEGMSFIEQIKEDLNLDMNQKRIIEIKEWCRLSHLLDYREAIDLYVQQSKSSLKARKQITSQEHTKLQIDSKEKRIAELEKKIKTKLQNQIRLFQKSIIDKIKESINPENSLYAHQTAKLIGELPDLVEVKGVKRNYFGIDQHYEQNFYLAIQSHLIEESIQDSKSIADTLCMVKKELDDTLNEAEATAPNLRTDYITPQKIEEIFQGMFIKSREFEADQTKKGVYEYFMAIRKYQMLAMMFFSAFGLSFFTKYKVYLIPFSLCLLGFGGYHVVRTVKNERIEEGSRQLKKARNHLKSEVKHLGNDYARKWQNYVTDYLKRMEIDWLEELNESMSKWKSNQLSLEADKKNKIQRTQSGLEFKEKRIESFVRNLKSWDYQLQRKLQVTKRNYQNL